MLTPRPFVRTLGDQLRWMKSTRHSRPKGHFGTGFTFAMPFGVLGLIAGVASGHSSLGLALFAAAFANRLVQALVVGGWLLRDPRAVRLCWLYPLRDLQGFAIWCASYLSRDFYWRGETYRFTRGGRIIARDRTSSRFAMPSA